MSRIIIKKIQSSASVVKWYCGWNYYGEWDKLINAGTSTDEFPRCSEIETWEHAVRRRKKLSIRAEIILKLCECIKKVQIPGVIYEELITLIEDTRKFMKEDLVDLETN